MNRMYKVATGCCRKQPFEGNYSQMPLEALQTDQQSALSEKDKTTSMATSSAVVQQNDDATSSPEDVAAMEIVDATWKMVDEQSAEEMRRREEASALATAVAAAVAAGLEVKVKEGWKTIRVFVSSTFTDMHSEREMLVKKVFPELREWCEERKFFLVDCDLRWGVPKDSPSRTTICTCLEEIDRCHEDNECLPFFVSTLSDRYGWIPSESEVPEDVKEKYEWVPHTSITHMEILHGAYRFNNPNAIFCLRNSSYVENLPPDKIGRFVEQELLNQLHLKVLKQRLAQKFSNQVFEYDCRVDGVDSSTGREKEGLRVMYHCVEMTDVSRTSIGIMRRIIDSLTEEQQPQQPERESEEPKEEDLWQQLKVALARASKTDSQLLIIIDGLDELIDNKLKEFLIWLPPRFPARLRCVVSSSANHHPCIKRLEYRDSLFLDLDQLTPDEAAVMAEYYLQRFNKKLDSIQLSSLLSHRSSSIPLWLSIACEELRVFGDFATVSSKIKNFPDELKDLMKDVIQRLIREDETQALQKVLSWIYCSKSGLPEKAILTLLGNPATNELAPTVTWATVRRHLKPFIRSAGESQSVRIQMTHKSMNEAMGELLFSVEGEDGAGNTKLIQCHTYLADFYQHHCSFLWMTLSELPHHLDHAKLGQRKIDFYRKDERTASINNYERSQIFHTLRCPCPVDNHNPSDESNRLYVCRGCFFRDHLLFPNSQPTKDMCAICGNWAPRKQPTNVAKVCRKHRVGGASLKPITAKCYTCDNIIFFNNSSSYTPLYLCTCCHTFTSIFMKCAYLEK